jgi:hypothetical protein
MNGGTSSSKGANQAQDLMTIGLMINEQTLVPIFLIVQL